MPIVLAEANLSLGDFMLVVAAMVLAIVVGITAAKRGWFEFNDEEEDDVAHGVAP